MPASRSSTRARRRSATRTARRPRKAMPKIAVAPMWMWTASTRFPKRTISSPPECGPAAVTSVPETTSAGGGRDEREREPRRADRLLGRGAANQVARALDDDHRHRERDQREQEVAHHDQRVQLEQDGDPAEHPLGEHGERQRDGAPEEPARHAGDAEGRDRGDQRREADDEARDAVPELDVGVVVLGRQERLAAARPVLAAQPGAREADGGARHDDEEERGEGRVGEPLEGRRRDRERAQALRARAGLHQETRTPLPATTRPTPARKRPSAAKLAASTGPLAAGRVKRSPPAVCGS